VVVVAGEEEVVVVEEEEVVLPLVCSRVAVSGSGNTTRVVLAGVPLQRLSSSRGPSGQRQDLAGRARHPAWLRVLARAERLLSRATTRHSNPSRRSRK
jgi:hypothetical protein